MTTGILLLGLRNRLPGITGREIRFFEWQKCESHPGLMVGRLSRHLIHFHRKQEIQANQIIAGYA